MLDLSQRFFGPICLVPLKWVVLAVLLWLPSSIRAETPGDEAVESIVEEKNDSKASKDKAVVTPEILFRLSLAKAYSEIGNYDDIVHELHFRRKSSLASQGHEVVPDIPDGNLLEAHVKRRFDQYKDRLLTLIGASKNYEDDLLGIVASAQAHFDCYLNESHAGNTRNDQLCAKKFIAFLTSGEKRLDVLIAQKTPSFVLPALTPGIREAVEGTDHSPFVGTSRAARIVESWFENQDQIDLRSGEIATGVESAAGSVNEAEALKALALSDELKVRESKDIHKTLLKASSVESAYAQEVEGKVLTVPLDENANNRKRDQALLNARQNDPVTATEDLLGEEKTAIPPAALEAARKLLDENKSINSFSSASGPTKNVPFVASIDEEREALVWVLHFDSGANTVRKKDEGKLPEILKTAKNYERPIILIFGHTDRVGEAGLNRKISRQRAETVRKRFVKDGIPGGNIVVHGFGESRPAEKTADGKENSANRRVVIAIMPS